MAILVHFPLILGGKATPGTYIVDFVELARSHTGFHMAQAFHQVMVDYGIEEKVRPTRQ